MLGGILPVEAHIVLRQALFRAACETWFSCYIYLPNLAEFEKMKIPKNNLAMLPNGLEWYRESAKKFLRHWFLYGHGWPFPPFLFTGIFHTAEYNNIWNILWLGCQSKTLWFISYFLNVCKKILPLVFSIEAQIFALNPSLSTKYVETLSQEERGIVNRGFLFLPTTIRIPSRTFEQTGLTKCVTFLCIYNHEKRTRQHNE